MLKCYSAGIHLLFILVQCILISSCDRGDRVEPVVVTEKVTHDTDDPAIWYNASNPEKSIVFGTDKDTDGGIIAFDLAGKPIPEKCVKDIRRPNNIDIEYGLARADGMVDVIVCTERERQQVRVFSVPDMMPMDRGGFPVFEGEPPGDFRNPMGIAVYKDPASGEISIIVGRKNGPTDGTYVWQYSLAIDSAGLLHCRLVRKFGQFSGKREIEAIAVDDQQGYVYYADEGVGIRKYHADPARGNAELALFGTTGFRDDQEGIAILPHGNQGAGYILVSDQSAGAVRIFDRSGAHAFVRSVRYRARHTDGIEVCARSSGTNFPNGFLVAMSDDRTFHYYRLEDLGF